MSPAGTAAAAAGAALPPVRIRKREKAFPAGLARDGWVLLGLMALPVLLIGAWGLMTWRHHTGIWLVGVAVLLAATVGGGMRAAVRGKRIRVTPDLLILEQGKRKVILPWADMSKFAPPPAYRHYFRFLQVGDGTQEICIDSLTFPEFDLLLNLIIVARKHCRAGRDNTYELG